MLTNSEVERIRRDARESDAYYQKVFARRREEREREEKEPEEKEEEGERS